MIGIDKDQRLIVAVTDSLLGGLNWAEVQEIFASDAWQVRGMVQNPHKPLPVTVQECYALFTSHMTVTKIPSRFPKRRKDEDIWRALDGLDRFYGQCYA